MPAFNFSSVKKSASGSYGFLIDQLAIKQNQLESDGKLSPGDYDLLISQAQQLYGHPGLSASERSNVAVKLSQYNQEKKTSTLSDTSDINRMNREGKDDNARNIMMFANNPDLFLQASADSTKLKLDQLSSVIDSLQAAGADASAHLNEFSNTLNDYNDLLQAKDDVKNYDNSGQPKSGYAAYIVTNSQGEINDVKVGRIGSQTGYVETNGLYKGLPIYGKINRKEGSKNIFVLGSERFSAADVMIPDPLNPGATKASRLVSESQQSSGGMGFDTVRAGAYKDVDLTQVRPQSSIRSGGWVQGEKGFLYQRGEDGKYTKYVGADKTKLGISDNDIIKVPRSFEQNIVRDVTKTVDGTQPFEAPMGATSTAPAVEPAAAGAPALSQPQATGSVGRSPAAPTERAPSGIMGVAQNAFKAAGSFLGNLFR